MALPPPPSCVILPPANCPRSTVACSLEAFELQPMPAHVVQLLFASDSTLAPCMLLPGEATRRGARQACCPCGCGRSARRVGLLQLQCDPPLS